MKPESFDGRIWYLIMAEPRRELFATFNLTDRGFSVWLPICSVVTRHARRVEIKRAPLFPGYLFVGREVRPDYEQPFWPIMRTPGVAAVVKAGQAPLPVRQATLDKVAGALAAYQREHLIQAAPFNPNPFHAGQKLRVQEGPLTGLEGVCTLPAGERTAVLLRFLGQEQRALLPTHMLRPAE